MIRLLLVGLALFQAGCTDCSSPAWALRSPVGINHYVAAGDMASGGGGSWAFVQSASSYTAGGGTTPPISLAFSSNVTAGATLVVAVRCATGTGAVSASTGSQSFTLVQNKSYIRDHHLLYLKNATGGATTITVSGSASPGTYFDFGNIPVIIAEYSGLSTSAPLADSATKDDGGSYYTVTTTSVTATANGLLLVVASNDDGGFDRVLTPDAAFTSRSPIATPTNQSFHLLEKNAATSAGATGSLTVGSVSNSYWSTVAAAFSL